MKRALIVLLLTTGAAIAGPPSVTLPKEVAGEIGQWVIVPVETKDAGPVRWLSTVDPGLSEVPLAALFGDEWAAKAKGRVFTAKAPGRFRVFAWAGGDNRDSTDAAVCVVVVGGAPPAPTPGPTPGPQPPPGPTPGPAPIPGDGLRVLIVVETAELSKLPASQTSVLYGGEVRGYLNLHCVKDGNTAAWRLWDKDVNTAAESKVWQDAMARKRDKLPWIVISNGKAGYEGPLPLTVEDTLKLLRQYGGN